MIPKTTTVEIIVLCLLVAAVLGAGIYAYSVPPEPSRTHQVAESSQPYAYSVLENQGYTSIGLGGHPLLACGEQDSMFTSYNFTAINPAGLETEGAVCCGLLFKSCTIRF